MYVSFYRTNVSTDMFLKCIILYVCIYISNTPFVGCFSKCLLYMCVLKRNSVVRVFFFSKNSLNHMAFMVSKLEEDSFSSCEPFFSCLVILGELFHTKLTRIESFFLYFRQPPTTNILFYTEYKSFHIRRYCLVSDRWLV